MTDSSRGEPAGGPDRTGDRLDSWKEIAAYLRRDVTTVQRWEKREGMPVHRHLHDRAGSVYAFRAEIDAWSKSRSLTAEPVPAEAPGETVPPAAGKGRRLALGALAAAAVLVAAVAAWRIARRPSATVSALTDARFLKLTDFDGIEQAAAVSRDGRFVAFQSDRDGRMDVWLTQVGTGRFVNLTRGAAPELVNASVRTLGFSPDGSLVTFWTRGAGGPEVGVWAVPLLGGPPRPFLEGAAELDWSPARSRLAYHTAGPGDPMFVREPGAAEAREVLTAPPGLHDHFPLWSPDEAFLYFVRGVPPDHMDLWRIRPDGGTPERITRHDSAVSHPVFLDARTLLYLATDPDGSGPFIYLLDVVERVPRRVSPGVETYTSLAASVDGRRLVATLASPKRTLWRVPLAGTKADASAARRVPLTTADGRSPRLGPGYLLYVSAKGAGDGIWKLQNGGATEIWSGDESSILGAPAVRGDGRRLAFSVRQGGRTRLCVVNADGTDARVVSTALELHSAPAWTPDGESLTVAGVADGVPRLFTVPLDGRPPKPLLAEPSDEPVWSPDGGLLAFAGAGIGTTFPVKVVRADGRPLSQTGLRLDRSARRVAFMPGGRSLLVLKGEAGRRNLWTVDLDGTNERPVTELPSDFDVRDFDVSPDGTEIVLERSQENSDLVLIERARR